MIELTAPVGLVLMTAMFHLSTRLSRPEIFFAVTVDAAFPRSADARAIRTRFRRTLWLNCLAASGLMLLLPGRPAVIMGAMAWQMVAAFAALVIGHRQSLAYSQPQAPREIDLAPSRRLPGGYLQLLPYAILAAATLFVASQWNGTRSVASVFGPALASALGCVVLGGFALLIARTARAGTAVDRRMRDLNLSILLAVQIVSALVGSWILLQPTFGGARLYGFAVPAVMLLMFVGILVAAVVTTKRLSAGGGDFTPDACWKGGLFYYNPSDPAIFVEKRFGIGYTLNFGNRWAWIVMVLMLLPGVVMSLVAVMASR